MPLKAKGHHDPNHILSHGPLSVTAEIVTGFRARTVAIASQIRYDDGKIFCQRRRYVMPTYVRLRITMQ